MKRCPKCLGPFRVSRPAEPDVGLMVPVLECKIHGEFFKDDNGEFHFLNDIAETKPRSKQ